MMHIAYHASHEQFSPSDLLRYVRLAEEAGFGGIHSYLEPLNGKGKVDTLILHNVHPNQEDFLADFKWMKLGGSSTVRNIE